MVFAGLASTMPAVINDNFGDRLMLDGTRAITSSVEIQYATLEAGEPSDHPAKDIWYTWTAPENLEVTLSCASSASQSYATVNVYVGDTLATLSRICGTSYNYVTFLAVKGLTYQIALGGQYNSSTGYVQLMLTSRQLSSDSVVRGPRFSASGAPANDNIATPERIVSLPLSIVSYHQAATTEVGERHDWKRSLWYVYTPKTDQIVHLRVDWASRYTGLAVFQGDQSDRMIRVGNGSNGDLSFTAVAGTTYRIAICDQYDGSDGVREISLWSSPLLPTTTVSGPEEPANQTPRNDNFSNAQLLSGARTTAIAYTLDATRESFEPDTGQGSVWYRWTAPASGTVTLESVGAYPQLGLWSGSSLLSLTLLKSANGSTLSADVTAGTTYYISLGSVYSNGKGEYYLSLAAPGPLPLPQITGQPESVTVTAGDQVVLSVTAKGIDTSYQWRKAGVAIVGAVSPTLVLDHAGSADAAAYSVDVKNPAGLVTSASATVTVNAVPAIPSITLQPVGRSVTAGTALTLQVTAAGTGPFTYQWFRDGEWIEEAEADSLAISTDGMDGTYAYTVVVINAAGVTRSAPAEITVTPASGNRPANDAFANRIALSGTSFSITPIALDNATREVAEPGNAPLKSLWYSWTAPDNVTVTLDASASDYSTYRRIAVYLGNRLGALTSVTASSYGTVTFLAVKDATYQIAVGGEYSSSTGTLRLGMVSSSYSSGVTILGPSIPVIPQPINDHLANATTIANLPLAVVTYHHSATWESTQRIDGQRSLWYRYTAPADQTIYMAVETETASTRLGVYVGDHYDRMNTVATASYSSLSFIAIKGVTYYLEIADLYDTSYGIRRVAIAATPFPSGPLVAPLLPYADGVSNNAFLCPQVLTGDSVHALAYVTGANRETFEPDTAQNTVWYSWTPAADGVLDLSSGGDDIDRQVSVFTGGDLASLQLVGKSPRWGASTVSLPVIAGTPYRIAIGNYYDSTQVTTIMDLQFHSLNFGSIANQIINEDTSTGSVAFKIAGSEASSANLKFTITTSNPTLVPVANVVIAGSGANRTVMIKPAPNQSGTATITLTVTNGSVSATKTFTLTVKPVNDAPAIGTIASRTLNEDTPATIPFTVTDSDTAVGSLVLSATSSNTKLLPAASLVLGGSGNNRTLTLTPAVNQSGTATVTLTAGDGSLKATRSFTVTVKSVNDAPTISAIAGRTIAVNGTTGALTFKVADIDTPLASLTVTASSSDTKLIPTKSIVLGGSGANRTIKITAASGKTGTATITIKVNDGKLTATTGFFVTVTASNHAPTLTAIANQTTKEDTATAALSFKVADAETSAGLLLVSATSSNTGLVPAAGIALEASGANRKIKLTPAANQNGKATITIQVSDGALKATRTFTLTVSAVNDAPTIAVIADQNIAVNGSTNAIPFQIGDVDTATTKLKVTAASSNSSLVPASGLILGGSGANRTIRVTPVKARSGKAVITLTVSDGALKATRQFTVTVAAGLKASSLAAPTLTRELTDQIALVGDSAEFLVGTADAPDTYQWRKDGAILRDAHSARFALDHVQPADAGTYAVEVTSPQGVTLHSTATLAVVRLTAIVTPLDPGTVRLSGRIEMSGEQSGWSADILLPNSWKTVFSEASGSRTHPIADDAQLLSWTGDTPASDFTIVLQVPSSASLPTEFDALVEVQQPSRANLLAIKIK